MALPGLSLPGLGMISTPLAKSLESSSTSPTLSKSTQSLSSEQEYRFESSFNRPICIKLITGTAEIFGTELAPSLEYTLTGTKAAVFTWTGCEIEVTGGRDEDYIADASMMYQYANVHFALEDSRQEAQKTRQIGPRLLLIGPENVGKTALSKLLISYATKQERTPILVNLDHKEGCFSVPSSLTATSISSVLDIEQGWGTSPISGPSSFPVKTPLCYPFSSQDILDNPKLYKNYITRLSLAVSSRYESNKDIKYSGTIIDTPGVLGTGNPGTSDIIQHIVEEFDINSVIVLGSADKVYNELKNRFHKQMPILRLEKSGGCVDRDDTYMRELRQSQIREYFYGHGSMSLTPFTQMVDFNQVAIYKIIKDSANNYKNKSFNPGAGYDDDDNDEEEEYDPASVTSLPGLHERINPSALISNALLAVTQTDANSSLEHIKDSSILCYVYVADVDEAKKRLKLLSPINGRIPTNALIWGNWPESISGLLT